MKKINEVINEENKEEFGSIISKTIPPLYQESNFEQCDEKIKKIIYKEISSLKEIKGLYLFGDCGVGKTYTLFAIYKVFVANGLRKHTRIINASTWMAKLRENYDDKYVIRDFKDELKKIDLLLIDDIGSDRTTDYATDVLYEVINYRHDYMLPTFFTSNLSVKELAQKYSDRIASRIAGMCEIIKLEGQDRRIK